AISGFAADALLELERKTARRIALAALLLISGGLILGAIFSPAGTINFAKFTPRALALGLVAVMLTARLSKKRASVDERLDRLAVLAGSLSIFVYCALSIVVWAEDKTGVDPLLLVVLVAESMALVYIVQRRIEVQILLSRAITYVILSLGVAVVAALA